ncbi:MAG: hypothetical protein Q9177_005274 [Variospora cf. flavescens]
MSGNDSFQNRPAPTQDSRPLNQVGSPPYNDEQAQLNTNGVNLRTSPARDRTLHHYEHQRVAGAYGVGAQPNLQHSRNTYVHPRNPGVAQPLLPSVHDVENGSFENLPSMRVLARMDYQEAFDVFVRARQAALGVAPLREIFAEFDAQWVEQRRREAAEHNRRMAENVQRMAENARRIATANSAVIIRRGGQHGRGRGGQHSRGRGSSHDRSSV